MKGINFIFLLMFLVFKLLGDNNNRSFKIYKVQKGDNIELISRVYTCTVDEIKRLNPDINFNNLKENDLIIVIDKKPESLLIKNLRGDKIEDKEEDKEEDIPDIIREGFIIHSVKKKETKYGISKDYSVSILEINQNNKHTVDGLNYKDIIKIPLNDNNKKKLLLDKRNTKNNYNIHIVKKGDNLWRLCYEYKITKEQLQEINPFLSEGLIIGDSLYIPKKNIYLGQNNVEEDYVYYEVQSKDTKYGISKKFNVAISEMDKYNPEHKTSLKEGVILKLPKREISEVNKLNVDDINIVMMLPFYSSENLKELKKEDINDVTFSSKTEIALDYYFGSMQALEDFKEKYPNKNINVKIYDTENSIDKVQKILDENNFDNIDFIIGPLYSKNTEYLAKALQNKNIPVVSPLSDKHILTKISNIIQITPTDFIFQNKVLNKMIDEYNGENIVVAGTIFDLDKIDYIKEKLGSTIKKDNPSDIKYVLQKGDFLVLKDIKKMMDTSRSNVLIIPSRDISLTSSIISLANYFNKEEKGIHNKVYYLENLDVKNYKKLMSSLPTDYFSGSSFIYSTSYFADDNKITKDFEENYRKRANKLASRYSYIGYDCLNFALTKFIEDGNLFIENKKIYRGITTNYKIEKKINSCYYNSEVVMVRFSKIGIPYVVF